MTGLVDALLARVAADNAANPLPLGTVTAINATGRSLTVDIAGTPVSGVRWLESYTPALADFVAVQATTAGWLVLGKLSKNLASSGPSVLAGQSTVRSHALFSGLNPRSSGAWFWFSDSTATQGLSPVQEYHAAVYLLSPLAESLPSGATVTAAKLRLTRESDDSGTMPLSPVVRLHAYTGSPVSMAASWIGAEWRPGTVAVGQSATWDLPSTWLTQLLAGSAKGIGLASTRSADYSFWLGSAVVTIDYTVPV